MEYTKEQLAAYGLERHGYGLVHGYSTGGFAGSWFLRTSRDVSRLPSHLVYVWQS
jgi:hypothetical protein